MATAPKRIPETQPELPGEEPRDTTEPILTDGGIDHEHPTLEEIAAEAYAIYIANGASWLDTESRLRQRKASRA